MSLKLKKSKPAGASASSDAPDAKLPAPRAVAAPAPVAAGGDDSDDGEGVSLFAASVKKKAARKQKADASAAASAPAADVAAAAAPATGAAGIAWNTLSFNPKASFSDLGLAPWQTRVLASLAITKPTEIQQRCIPAVLAGHDIVGRAKTGSGKTAAFALPILHTLSQDPFGICALVLTPTRELAYQIADQFRALGAPMNVDAAVVIGGMEIAAQCAELERRPHVVIATPGRLAQLLSFGGGLTFHASHLQYLVLDEADRLFEEQFVEPITEIVARLPPIGTRQTMLFSATITQDMLEANQGFVPSADGSAALAARPAAAPFQRRQKKKAGSTGDEKTEEEEEAESTPRARLPALMKDPVFIQVSSDDDAFVHTLDQRYLFMPQAVKEVYLTHILQPMKPDHDDYAPSKSVIVFTSTCRGCEFVAELLTRLGVPCAALHSRVSQQRRLAALGKFRSGLVKVLVATDVASRGLDIPSVALVVNYDVPRSLEDYVHRTGRTARAGRGGRAVSFVSQYDVDIFKSIEAFVGKEMEQYEGAAEDDVLELLKDVNEAKKITKLRLAEYELTAKKFRAGDAEVVDEKAVKAETKRRFTTAGIGLAKHVRGAKQRQGQVKRRKED